MTSLSSSTVMSSSLGQLRDVLFLGGQELVQRGIQEADGHRAALHGLVHGLEVALLIGQDLGQSLLAVLDVLATIISRMALMRSPSKNMCSVRHRPMPSAPNLHGLRGVAGGVGVGADLQLAELVGPAHEAAEVAGDGGVARWRRRSP